jgi:type VI secretion system VasD/TssJ family lipoprotein
VWSYEKNAVELTFEADSQLNRYNDKAHTLQLCIYQLKDPNGFNQLKQSEDGLYKLLECGMFDGSVANYRSLNVAPGERRSILIDRAEGAKYIGVAAGYAEIQKDRITRLLEIPVVIVKEGGTFRKQKVARPDTLKTVLRLAPHQIETGSGD